MTRKLARPVAPPVAAAAVTEISALPVVPIDGDLVTAASASCDRLQSEDLAAGTTIGVTVVNPFAPPA